MSRILFADHNGFTQRMGIQFLTAEGHDVASASGGLDALRYIQQQRPDIAILDTQMAEPSGLELCWRIKSDSNLRDTKVVLLNRVLDPIPESEAEKAGSDAMLLKPLDGPTLVGAVNSLIEKKRCEIDPRPDQPESSPSNGSGFALAERHGERQCDEQIGGFECSDSANGTNGLAALEAAVSIAAETSAVKTSVERDFAAPCQPVAVMAPAGKSTDSNGAAPAAGPGRPVAVAISREETQIMSETEVCVEQERDFAPAVDFAAIVDEALGNDAEERELQNRIERAIQQILQPAINAVAENVTKEVYVAYRAQRRVEQAVNGLLLPAIVSIADGSSQGVMAAFRSK